MNGRHITVQGFRSAISLAALGIALALALAGCVAPPVTPTPSADPTPSAPQPSSSPSDAPSESPSDAPSDYPTEGPGEGGPNPDQLIDPNHPWPSDVPRPPGTVTYESSAPNPLGEGSVWNIMFEVDTLASIETYIGQLAASGWSELDDRQYPVRGSDGSLSWAMSKGTMLAELSVAATNTQPVKAEFAILSF